MAKPIEFAPVPRNPREELKQRIENAPAEHAAAILSAYELLDELHRGGILDALRGAASAGGEIVTQASTLASQPESIRAMRNMLVLGRLLGSIDPDLLQRLTQAVPASLERLRREPPSLFELLRRFNSPGSRRALAASADIIDRVGTGLASGK